MTADSVQRIGNGGETPEGRNAAYLVDGRVVVDPGPPTDDARADLESGLERAGASIGDLEYVLVTHWHVDHAGLAPRLADAAGATLAMGAADAPLVADYEAERDRRLERDRETMRRWGVPPDAVDGVIERDVPSPMPASTPVERLAAGDRIAGLEVVPTPGHTLGHAAFAGDGFVLVGDAVLPSYTPNVGGSDTRTLDIASDGASGGTLSPATDPLEAFLESLERLDERTERLLPGHGTAIEPGRLVESRSHHEERSRRVLAALEERERATGVTGAAGASSEAATPWELARDLFGDLEGIHVKFGAGEAAAHCRHLERTGAVERVDCGRRVGGESVRYRTVRHPSRG